MGLFSFNFSKPGPGVNADEPEKKGFFRFWEIIFEKFTKLLGTNCFHIALSIPYLIILYIIAPVNLEWVQNMAQGMITDASSIDQMSSMLNVSLRMLFSVGVFLLWGSGPSSAMYAYITRCFTRRDPVWIMSDGMDKFRENFKQGILVAIIDFIVLIMGMNAIYFYYSIYQSTANIGWMFLFSLMVMLMVVYTWMHYYIYQIMVTFECTLGQLYKNSILFAIAMLPMNVLITIISVGIIILSFLFLIPVVAALVDLVFLSLFIRFPMEFSAARKINKTIINQRKKEMPKKEYIEEDNK